MSALAGSRISTKPSGFVPALVSILYVVCSKALLVCGGFHEVRFPVTERYDVDDLAFSLTPSSTKRYKMHMLLKVSIPAKMKREEFQFV